MFILWVDFFLIESLLIYDKLSQSLQHYIVTLDFKFHFYHYHMGIMRIFFSSLNSLLGVQIFKIQLIDF